MSKALITEQTLTDIANNIRAKTGEDITMTPSEMSNKIKTGLVNMSEIANGFDYSNDVDTVNILLNNKSDLKFRYCFYQKTPGKNINVKLKEVSSTGNMQFFYTFSESNIQKVVFDVSNGAGLLFYNTFQGCKSLIDFEFIGDSSNTAELYNSTFRDCTNLKNISGIHSNLRDSVFYGCINLLDNFFDAKKNPLYGQIGPNTFYNCKAFLNVNMLSYGVFREIGYSAFYGCSNMKSFAAERITKGFQNTTFGNCSSLEALILTSTTMTTASSSNFLNKTKINNGTGYIYVPDSLVNSYKTATNQVVYADQIKPISELPEEYKTIYNL